MTDDDVITGSTPSDGYMLAGSQWAIADVTAWLETIGLDQYCATFEKNKIDGIALLLLNAASLREMEITVCVKDE